MKTASTPSPSPAIIAATAAMEDGQLVVRKGDKSKSFNRDKLILLPDQSKDIRRAICTDPSTGRLNPHTVTIGPTGYSDVKRFIATGEIQADTYRNTCQRVIERFATQLASHTQARGWSIPLVITHGASDMEIDKASRDTATNLNIRQFGFNQPEWMFYVPDDDVPVYVGSDKEDYHHKFAAHTMILLMLGGRDDAAYHDRLNCQQYRNLVLPCPVLPFLMKNPPPAWDLQFDLEREMSDPVEWATRVPILDASLAHLRSIPHTHVEQILAGPRTQDTLIQLVDYLAELGANYLATYFRSLAHTT